MNEDEQEAKTADQSLANEIVSNDDSDTLSISSSQTMTAISANFSSSESEGLETVST